MSWQSEFLNTLKNELESRKLRNSRFSMRAFAKKIKLSPGALSEMLRGGNRWKLTVERGAEIVDNLDLSQAEKNRLLTIMGQGPKVVRKEIQMDDYDILLDWIYLAILSCHDLPVAERSAEKISVRLGRKKEVVQQAIDALLKKGYLQASEQDSKVLERNPTYWAAGDGPPSHVLMEHHRNNLRMALQALDTVPREERHYSSLTYVGSRETVESVRQEIQLFQERLTNLMNKGDQNDEVFRISVSLFPLKAPIEEAQK